MQFRSNYIFKNWAGNQTITARNFYKPQTNAEIAQILAQAEKVRVVGSGHSWSDICLCEDTFINLDSFNKVLRLDKDKLQVTVQPGIKLWQLNEYLDKQDLALPNLGSIAKQSVAGAISTGTHGSGINYPILAGMVEQFKLLKADGSEMVLHCERDKELFNKAIVSLGSLGVVTEMTLNVVPAFRLLDETYVAGYDEVVNNLDELVHGTDHFKLWWFPHVDKVVVYRYTRTPQPATDSRFRQWFMDEFLSVQVYRMLLKLGHVNREWRRNINSTLVTKFINPLNRTEKSYKVFNVPEPPLHRETEWAFDYNCAKELLREYKRMIDASAHRINFIQEIRFTKADNYALSPAYGRNTMWLGAYNADNFGWTELLNDFEQLAKTYNGRPHWGKEFTVGAYYLEKQYPQFASFQQLRKDFDPHGKFANPYIEKIFS